MVKGNNNNTNQVVVIDSPITINLTVFGKDGVKNLTYDEIVNLMNSNENLVQFLIKNVNLNPNKPQHHNILYTNLRSAYEKDGWVEKKISEIIDKLIDAKLEDLNDIMNEMNFLTDDSKQKIRDTIIGLDRTKPGARKKFASYIKPILYNHREMIEKTKLTKEQEDEIIRQEQEEAEIEAAEEERQLKKKSKKKSLKNK